MLSDLRDTFKNAGAKAYQKYLDWYFAPLANPPKHPPYPMNHEEFMRRSGLDQFADQMTVEGTTCLGYAPSLKDYCTLHATLILKNQGDGRTKIKLYYHKSNEELYSDDGFKNLYLEAVFENVPQDFSAHDEKISILRPEQTEPKVFITSIYTIRGLWREHRTYQDLSADEVAVALSCFHDKLHQLSLYSKAQRGHFNFD